MQNKEWLEFFLAWFDDECEDCAGRYMRHRQSVMVGLKNAAVT